MKETTVELLYFRFRGGDVPLYRINGGSWDQSFPAWQDTVQHIGRTWFPTNPPTIGVDIDDMVFINRPGFSPEDGIRIHCVYFRVQGSRPFRNVFCFAYRNAECPLSVLASVSAEEWWDACRTLSEQSTLITLPCHASPRDLSKLEDTSGSRGYLLYHFPDSGGDPVTMNMTKEEFEKLLTPQEAPSSHRSQGYGEHRPGRGGLRFTDLSKKATNEGKATSLSLTQITVILVVSVLVYVFCHIFIRPWIDSILV